MLSSNVHSVGLVNAYLARSSVLRYKSMFIVVFMWPDCKCGMVILLAKIMTTFFTEN